MLPSSLIALCSAASPPQCHKISMSLFDNLWADSAQSPDVAKALDAICCEGGWDVKCTIGQTAARDLRSRIEDRSGGALPSTLLDSTSSDVGIQFSVAFEPQGTVRLLSSSRFLSTTTADDGVGVASSIESGCWKVTSTDDDDVPTALRWRLECDGIRVGGESLVPEGPVYFNALTTAERRRRGVDPGSGRVTIREDSSVLSALFGTRGLIEEFKTVGSFAITPR